MDKATLEAPKLASKKSGKSWLSAKLAAERKKAKKSCMKNWDLYLLLIPVLAYFIVFHY